MPLALRNVLLFVMLSAAAIASWFLSRPQQVAMNGAQSRPSAPLGYYLRNAVIIGTDANGMVSYRVYAALAEQTAQDEELMLTDVRVEYDTRESISWLVTAERAAARGGGEQLDLYGVRLTNRPAEGTDAMVIETEELQLTPETYIALANLPVAVTRGGARLRSSSMSANLKTDLIDLEGVDGRYGR